MFTRLFDIWDGSISGVHIDRLLPGFLTLPKGFAATSDSECASTGMTGQSFFNSKMLTEKCLDILFKN